MTMSCFPCLPIFSSKTSPLVSAPTVEESSTPKANHEVVEVIVIGAGFAGLACALNLAEKGVSCLLLEARERPGGRCWSRTSQDGTKTTELGAEFIHGEKTATWRYLERYGLKGCNRGNPVGKPGVSALEEGWIYAYLDGKLLTPAQVREGNKVYFAQLDEAISNWVRDGLDSRISVGELVQQRPSQIFGKENPSKEEQSLFHGMMAEWYSADLKEVSILEDVPTSLIEEALKAEPSLLDEDGEEGHWRVKKGYSALAEAMAAEAISKGVQVIYNEEVQSIDWSWAGGVRVTTKTSENSSKKSSNGARKSTGEGDHFFIGHSAVVTLPLGCLQQDTVSFSPALPKAKLESIRQLGNGLSFKLALEFESTFWPSDMQFLFTPYCFQVWWESCSNTLMTLVGGESDVSILEKFDDEVAEEALRQLNKIFVESGQVKALPKLKSHTLVRWAQDPWARMGYSFHRVGCRPDARLRLREPCWPLLWAGEACHPTKSALVHGALETGEMAASVASDHFAFSLVDLRELSEEPRAALLKEVYVELLERHFPIQGELDDIDDMAAGLEEAGGKNPELHIVVARERSSHSLAGCACYEYYPSGDFALISYLCVMEPFRRKHVAQMLIQSMELQLSNRTGRLGINIFAETHEASVQDGIMDPLIRQKVLLRFGFRCLDFSYTQPPLNEHEEPCGGLRLLVKDKELLAPEEVITFLDGFAGSVTQWDESWKTQPYYQAQVRDLTSKKRVSASGELPW
eukprot:CAMPEP_0206571992 /NCGR_PEP_ID=MMETSP0325_2-20121206/27977_1 /ASSEMBLY_ACC=CAM_ASM_000347 /TAXON_ID=2866 /ORGANISM="Crypthecodinium cohnii, Strain Seligo" /LENGTH=745 /DNA_ID=CAMNT_0054076105 /DNA_START=31 /DNA_END=2265 /DNA_ORIENTATION=-